MTSELARYARANAYINEGLIRLESTPDPTNRSRRDQMRALLPLIGQPQRAYPAIHVAGTSGKGSVSALIAHILHASGARTGLHVSPYVQLATEKLWVDGAYASADEYVSLVDWFRPIAEQLRGPHVPLHGLASVAICLEHFRRSAVDVAVMETGVGGRRDITTVVDTKVAVVTNVGLDHQRTLGPSLGDIAWHKAGIIRPGCRALVLASAADDPLLEAATRAARQARAPLRVLRPDDYSWRVDDAGTVYVSFHGERLQLRDAPLALSGGVQAANAALALAACEELDPQGRWVCSESAAAGLAHARLPARQEWIGSDTACWGPLPPCAVLLDGAHNNDKVRALTGALERKRFRRIHLLYGALHGKESASGAASLAERVDTLVVTEPRVYGKPARPAEEVATQWQSFCSAPLLVEPDPTIALNTVLARADAADLVVITGSFYLAGALRARWYPDEEVLTQRTSWPRGRI